MGDTLGFIDGAEGHLCGRLPLQMLIVVNPYVLVCMCVFLCVYMCVYICVCYVYACVYVCVPGEHFVCIMSGMLLCKCLSVTCSRNSRCWAQGTGLTRTACCVRSAHCVLEY